MRTARWDTEFCQRVLALALVASCASRCARTREREYAPVSQIWALMVLPSTWIERVANSTPMVDLDSRLNSFRVNRDSRLDLPTPESPIRTTLKR